MANPRPYDDARRVGGVLSFVADLPAFAAFGRRHDALSDAYFHFEYPESYRDAERAFARDVKDAADRALSGGGGADWDEADAGLERRYGDKYRGLKQSLPTLTRGSLGQEPA